MSSSGLIPVHVQSKAVHPQFSNILRYAEFSIHKGAESKLQQFNISLLTGNSECDTQRLILREDVWIICRIIDGNLTNVYTSIRHTNIG